MKKKRVRSVLFLVLCILCFPGILSYAMNPQPLKMEFSSNEIQYMQSKKVLKVSIITNGKPFSYMSTDGIYQGLPVMILNHLSEEMGISLEFVPAKSYNESLEQLNEGKVDMIGVSMEYFGEKADSMDGTNMEKVPYLTAQAVLIQHKNTNLSNTPIVTIADIKGRNEFTCSRNTVAIYYATPQECLNAVRCGQADVMVCDSFTGSAMMQQYTAKDLLLIPVNMTIQFSFGILPDTDDRLVSILQKTINCFSNGDITRDLMEGSDYSSDNFMEFIYRYPFEIICFGTAIMFVVMLALITYTKVNIRQHQELQGYEESYRLLSDTFGEAGMEYDYLNDSLTIFGKHSNLDIEQKIDHFKENLENRSIRISLTAEQLARIISDGAENKSFSTEFQCGVKSGEWVWYRLIYTVVCTTESHRRPIRLVGCLANIDAEHAERERLMKLSSDDQLTGLLNHKTAEGRIRLLLEKDPNSCISMMILLDIDYFKQFNDQKGHLCGDDVLRSLGQNVCEIFTSADILCRWGGDEFLLFFVEDKNKMQNMMEFTDKIEQLQKNMSIYQYRGVVCPVTLSIGGAKSYPGCTFDILFQQADDALYLAKKNGRNQFQFYAPTQW